METLINARMHRRNFQKLALALALPTPLALAALDGRSAGIALAQSTDPTGIHRSWRRHRSAATTMISSSPRRRRPGRSTRPTRRNGGRCSNLGCRERGWSSPATSTPQTASRFRARCSISGKPTMRGSMTTRGIACAVISSRMRMVASSWRRSCRGSIPAVLATSTSKPRLRTSRFSRRSSISRTNRPTPRTASSTPPW